MCLDVTFCALLLQSSSYGESISTLGFGSRVSEITLGQAKKNSESAQIFEAKDQVIRYVQLCISSGKPAGISRALVDDV